MHLDLKESLKVQPKHVKEVADRIESRVSNIESHLGIVYEPEGEE